MDFVDVVEEKLKVEEITDKVSSASCGAVSVFIGTTRDNFDGKRVLTLDYEAYLPMAKRKMQEVCQTIREKWDVENIAIIHRIGPVPVKEASIVIAISSAHRKESLEAVHFAIDTVKAIVPVWKKEIYDDDTCTWKQNKECAWSSDPPMSSSPDHSAGTSSGDKLVKEGAQPQHIMHEHL
ncbi:molybdopterin synthase catalytic subunit 1-like [Physella acuta]|uniref:molybdopterin synthase catalytic subunit 1-like n=1 Tax=Physella acuta TaxID=109671 RepID=UPI0027DD2FF9|nr:molybdopterin synthase catalytic subunit 1-like [Physella acuta]